MDSQEKMIHFYNDEKYLFKTVSMYNENDRDQIFDRIVENKSWYWGRFQKSERKGYISRRIKVENMLYEEFSENYWRLKEKIPVFFYLIPNLSISEIESDLLERENCGEAPTKYKIVELGKIRKNKNVTFTIRDSHRSYKQKLNELNLHVKGAVHGEELKDYGRIFPIDEIDWVHEKYESVKEIKYEVQIWDRELLHSLIEI
jgi:hypothetical protein